METTKDRTPAGTAKQEFLELVFLKARTHSYWLPKEVPDQILCEAYDLARMGPTSANCQPMRIVFVKSKEGKERLKPALSEGNVEKTMKAPVTAIIAYDTEFYEHLPRMFPQADARSWFAGKPDVIQSTAFRNGTLQGGYFMLACRSLGLDVGPMSGFDNAKVDAEFFSNSSFKSNFLCNIGFGDVSKLHPRNPRFEFSEVTKVL